MPSNVLASFGESTQLWVAII